MAVVLPVVMLVLLIAVQMGLWAHASNLVQAAASEGVTAASLEGSRPGIGSASAREFLETVASHAVTAPTVVEIRRTTGSVEVEVSATAESIIPWLGLRVSAARVGNVQEFRTAG